MKKAFIFLTLIIFTLSLLFCCTGCSSHQKYQSYSFEYFDTVTTVIGYENSRAEFEENFQKTEKMLKKYHNLFSIYESIDGIANLHTVNTEGVKAPVKVESEIIDLLEFGIKMHRLTDGCVNVAMGSVLSIWKEFIAVGNNDPKNALLPSYEKLQNASKHTDITKLIIDKDASTVFLSDPEMQLDVGAVAKGYAAQKIAEYMYLEGMYNYSISIGGNVKAIASRTDGKKWSAAIENPFKNEEEPYVEYLELDNLSLVTSGNYQRYFEYGGKKYHHIIDPQTLMPTDTFASVSIICKDSALADALSTALFVMDSEKGKELIESTEGTEALWITESGEKIYSSGFKSYCN